MSQSSIAFFSGRASIADIRLHRSISQSGLSAVIGHHPVQATCVKVRSELQLDLDSWRSILRYGRLRRFVLSFKKLGGSQRAVKFA